MDSYEGNAEDPSSLHKYLYYRADPVDGIDLSGHDENAVMQSSTIGFMRQLPRAFT